MKICVPSLLAVLATLSGCAEATHDKVNPYGDHPDMGTGNIQAEGTLTVIGPKMAQWTEGGQGEHEVNGEILFSVYDTQGRLVANADSNEIHLAPGRYLVRTDNERNQPTIFWVTIESGKTTQVDVSRVQERGGATRVE